MFNICICVRALQMNAQAMSKMTKNIKYEMLALVQFVRTRPYVAKNGKFGSTDMPRQEAEGI